MDVGVRVGGGASRARVDGWGFQAPFPDARTHARLTRHAAAMQTAFEGVGSMPMGTIRRHRERKQKEVDREFAARETRAALRAAVQQG